MKRMFWGYAHYTQYEKNKYIKLCVNADNQWEACKKVEKILLAKPIENVTITTIELSEVHTNITQYNVNEVMLVI